jgi:hypothetical protein
VYALTPASADDLPPLGELIVDDPFWRHPSGTGAGEGVAHLRVWTTATVPPGHLAVVTDIGLTGGVTSSAGSIRAELVRVYGQFLVLLEYSARQEAGPRGDLDSVRVGRDGQLHWTRVWPTDKGNPRHAALQAWMAAHGSQILDIAADDASWYENDDS